MTAFDEGQPRVASAARKMKHQLDSEARGLKGVVLKHGTSVMPRRCIVLSEQYPDCVARC